MILAHHAGEEIIPTLVAGGGSAVSILLLVWRARLSEPRHAIGLHHRCARRGECDRRCEFRAADGGDAQADQVAIRLRAVALEVAVQPAHGRRRIAAPAGGRGRRVGRPGRGGALLAAVAGARVPRRRASVTESACSLRTAITRPEPPARARTSGLTDAPFGFTSKPFLSREAPDRLLTIRVSPDDCTGCGVCVDVCPAKSKTDSSHKAINMEPQAPLRDAERSNYDFFLNLPELDRADVVLRQAQELVQERSERWPEQPAQNGRHEATVDRSAARFGSPPTRFATRRSRSSWPDTAS